MKNHYLTLVVHYKVIFTYILFIKIILRLFLLLGGVGHPKGCSRVPGRISSDDGSKIKTKDVVIVRGPRTYKVSPMMFRASRIYPIILREQKSLVINLRISSSSLGYLSTFYLLFV